jgi:hypothetical protein
MSERRRWIGPPCQLLELVAALRVHARVEVAAREPSRAFLEPVEWREAFPDLADAREQHQPHREEDTQKERALELRDGLYET